MLKILRIWLALMLLALPIHAAEINDFNVIDANNVARWPEGMAFASVNDAGRADEGIFARYWKDVNGSLTTTGAANAYVLSANQTLTAYYAGMRISAKANFTNTGAATLNVDGLGAASISNAGASAIVSGRIYDFVHDGTNFQVLGQASEFPTGTKLVFFQATCPAGWTQDVANNNKALRIVSTAGGGTAGSQPFTTAFASQTPAGTNSGTAITEAQMPLHGHPFRTGVGGDGNESSGGMAMEPNGNVNHAAFTGTPTATAGQQIGGTGGGQTHTHTFTGNAINLAVQYLDVIICARS